MEELGEETRPFLPLAREESPAPCSPICSSVHESRAEGKDLHLGWVSLHGQGGKEVLLFYHPGADNRESKQTQELVKEGTKRSLFSPSLTRVSCLRCGADTLQSSFPCSSWSHCSSRVRALQTEKPPGGRCSSPGLRLPGVPDASL